MACLVRYFCKLVHALSNGTFEWYGGLCELETKNLEVKMKKDFSEIVERNRSVVIHAEAFDRATLYPEPLLSNLKRMSPVARAEVVTMIRFPRWAHMVSMWGELGKPKGNFLAYVCNRMQTFHSDFQN